MIFSHKVYKKIIIKDDLDLIKKTISDLTNDTKIDAIITTGGTGLTGRDSTPEAIIEMADKFYLGIDYGIKKTGIAIAQKVTKKRRSSSGRSMKSASTGGERSKKHVVLLSGPPQQHVRQRSEAALEPLARAAGFALLRRDGAADVGVLRPRDFPRRGAAAQLLERPAVALAAAHAGALRRHREPVGLRPLQDLGVPRVEVGHGKVDQRQRRPREEAVEVPVVDHRVLRRRVVPSYSAEVVAWPAPSL